MYYGEFSSKEDICEAFRIADFEGVVLYADYEYESYDGNANVIFIKGNQFFYVSGGHCSCYGLEDQWEPEAVTVEMLLHMHERGSGFWKQSKLPEILDRIQRNHLAETPDEWAVAIRMLL